MKKKILLVDDSKMILMMEKMILGHEPYELLVAHDGREAVEKALAEKPDLVLLDVMMPEMSGFEVLEQLRAEAATRSIPVIMVTTRGEAEHVAQGQASGCDEYLTKPIDSRDLLAKVRSLLKT